MVEYICWEAVACLSSKVLVFARKGWNTSKIRFAGFLHFIYLQTPALAFSKQMIDKRMKCVLIAFIEYLMFHFTLK